MKDVRKDRIKYDSAKYNAYHLFYEGAPKGLLPFWVADMDFPVSSAIIEAIRKRLDHETFGYTFPYNDEYFNAITYWYKKRFDWEIDANHLLYMPKVLNTLQAAVRQLTKKGEEVVIQQPVYGPFSAIIEANERVVLNNPLVNNEGYYTIDFDDLEKKLSKSNVNLMIFCSPHNPIGRIWSINELTKVVELCEKHQVNLVVDEIHCDITRKEVTHTPVLKLFPSATHIISCISIGKTFNLSGLQASHAVIPNDQIREKLLFDAHNLNNMVAPDIFSAEAMKAAYMHGEEWLEEIIEVLDNNATYIETFIQSKLPKIKYRRPEGTYAAWLDFSSYDLTAEEISDILMNKCGVVLGTGSSFGKDCNKFFRIIFATTLETIETLMNKIYQHFGGE